MGVMRGPAGLISFTLGVALFQGVFNSVNNSAVFLQFCFEFELLCDLSTLLGSLRQPVDYSLQFVFSDL